MCNAVYHDAMRAIIDPIEDSIRTLSDPELVLRSLEFLYTGRTRLLSQSTDTNANSRKVVRRELV